jgi:hypothetical protein
LSCHPERRTSSHHERVQVEGPRFCFFERLELGTRNRISDSEDGILWRGAGFQRGRADRGCVENCLLHCFRCYSDWSIERKLRRSTCACQCRFRQHQLAALCRRHVVRGRVSVQVMLVPVMHSRRHRNRCAFCGAHDGRSGLGSQQQDHDNCGHAHKRHITLDGSG